MIILVLSLILFLVLSVLYVIRRVAKQKQHLDNLRKAMNEREEKKKRNSRG